MYEDVKTLLKYIRILYSLIKIIIKDEHLSLVFDFMSDSVSSLLILLFEDFRVYL